MYVHTGTSWELGVGRFDCGHFQKDWTLDPLVLPSYIATVAFYLLLAPRRGGHGRIVLRQTLQPLVDGT